MQPLDSLHPSERPRVLMISKACIVGIYQRKLEEIARLGVDLLTLVPPSWKDERGETRLERVYTEGYQLQVVPIALNGNFHLHFYPGLGQWIRDFRPQIVHIDEEPYNAAAWQALFHARRAGAKTLFFSWQNIVRQYPPPFSWGERWLLNNVDYALVGTESAASVWRAKGYTGRLAVVPQFGVDTELFKPVEVSSLQFPVSSPSLESTNNQQPITNDHLSVLQIGYVGRLVEEKGVHLLLEAVARLSGEWRLRIIGSGPMRHALHAQAANLNIADRIEWVEWVASTDMPAQYQQLDALVIPSLTRPNWKEQFGRVIIEAMAAGVPVIGSDSGAIPDIVGDAGLIVPEGDVEALKAALCKLQTDINLCQQIATAGRKRVLERFTHAQVAAATVAVYKELLSP
ncbi:MAG: glycosyltransferase family 4 protein [Anaerolineae bacterium]|nr:glycosyltransferase family 4 protein [Anaerolineae bacterium]